MTADSPQPSGGEVKKDPEALRLALFEEIDTIEGWLQPLQGPEAEAIRLDLAEKVKRLESLSENDLTSYKLPLLQKEIGKIKKKVQELEETPLLSTKSQLLDQIANVQDTLKMITTGEPNAQDDARQKLGEQIAVLKSKVEETRNQLEPLKVGALASEKSHLQNAIDALKQEADVLAIRSFLLGEFRDIKKILGSARVSALKTGELKFLQTEIASREQQLKTLPDEDLSAFRRDISKLKDRAEAVVLKPGFLAWLRSISVLFWLGLIPFILVIYMIYYSWWQHSDRDLIYQTATAYASAHPSATMPATESPTLTTTVTPSVSVTPTAP